MNAKTFFLIPILFVAVTTLSGQNLDEAQRLAESGRHAEAEAIYNAALSKDPDNVKALIGSGYNYSWWKQHDKAQLKFEAALAIEPENKAAILGQGYNHAWAGNYELAKNDFQKLEKMYPGDVEAKKGLGYVSLWSGRGQVAEQYFEDLILAYPKEVEYYIALAQANLQESEIKKARVVLRSGLQIDPDNRVANELLKSTYTLAAPVELDVWAGYSETGGESRFSLRTVQLTGQIARNLRMFLKYDNSLTLDLASLVRANQEAQAFSGGAVVTWNSKLISRVEYGMRLLPDNITQQVFSGEQVVFLPNNMSLKGGGFYGWSSTIPKEWLVYGSVRVPLTRWYALEPYYFLSKVEGAPSTENRFMLNNQFRFPKGYEVNLGLLFGKAGVGSEVDDKGIFGSYITTVLPISQTVWGLASLRWEKAPFEELKAAAFGVKLRLDK
ncbi:MAG: tetratricopeptide repeat protein [Saprospiraceae bacterium]|nr:tetratricopeptide repeat protein [Lewinellaceae bacterium]